MSLFIPQMDKDQRTFNLVHWNKKVTIKDVFTFHYITFNITNAILLYNFITGSTRCPNVKQKRKRLKSYIFSEASELSIKSKQMSIILLF